MSSAALISSAPCPLPALGQAHFIPMGWEICLRREAASYLLLGQPMALTLTTQPIPSLDPLLSAAHRNCQPALHGTEVTTVSPWVPGATLGHGLAHEVPLKSHTTADLRKCFYAKAVALGLSP